MFFVHHGQECVWSRISGQWSWNAGKNVCRLSAPRSCAVLPLPSLEAGPSHSTPSSTRAKYEGVRCSCVCACVCNVCIRVRVWARVSILGANVRVCASNIPEHARMDRPWGLVHSGAAMRVTYKLRRDGKEARGCFYLRIIAAFRTFILRRQ